jgi:hypothetical protein
MNGMFNFIFCGGVLGWLLGKSPNINNLLFGIMIFLAILNFIFGIILEFKEID